MLRETAPLQMRETLSKMPRRRRPDEEDGKDALANDGDGALEDAEGDGALADEEHAENSLKSFRGGVASDRLAQMQREFLKTG